jgi:hypothetical protein
MTSKTRMIAAAIVFAAAASAQAATTINGTIDTSAAFSPTNQSADGSTYYNAPAMSFPAAPVTIGEFDFSLPTGHGIASLSLSGNFGSDALGSATAPVDLFLNGVAVARCDAACAQASELADVAWSYSFSSADLAALANGKAVLTAVQQGPSQIVLDPTSLSAEIAPVPEPETWALMLGGLPIVAFLRRRAPRA